MIGPRRMMPIRLIAAALLFGAGCGSSAEGTGGCADPGSGIGTGYGQWSGPGPLVDESAVWPVDPRRAEDRLWGVEIVAAIPHDRGAFTQGLEFVDGRLIEGTGCRGRSEVREVDPGTGNVIARAELPPSLFGEGVTASGTEIIQLTWQSGFARRLDATTFAEVGTHDFVGEGWGICAGDDTLVMSNGSSTLTHRDPTTFEPVRLVEVYRGTESVSLLNELECIDGLVMANVRHRDEIVVVDPSSGDVLATIDASPLRADVGTEKREETLNGIAAVGDGTFLLGGKHWPRHFIVRLTRD